MQAESTYPFWMVLDTTGRPLTLRLQGSRVTLPVFSFAEEAELFLRLAGGASSGCRIEGVSGEELISLVSDPRLDVERIALDPPGTSEALACLVSVGRQDFLRSLRGKAYEAAPPAVGSSWRRQFGLRADKAEAGGPLDG